MMDMLTEARMRKGKTRRTQSRRGPAESHTPEQCLADAQAALAKGDHAQAKRHAFEFAKSLPASPAKVEPDLESADTQSVAEPPVKAGPSGMSKLAAMLAARRKA